MNVLLSDEQLSQSIQQALLLSLSEPVKERMIGDAIKNLTTVGGGWDKKKSPLQESIEYAIKDAARVIIEAEISNPESATSQAIRALVADALVNLGKAEGYGKLVDIFSEALADALSGRRR